MCCNSIGLSSGDFEHIIVDGLSSDGSLEYAQGLSKTRLFTKVIKQTTPSIYGAFNDGLAAASGEYIIYLHCGDELNLETVMRLVKDFNGADMIAASCSQKSGDDELIYYRSERKEISVGSMSILQPSLIVRREKYSQVGGFDISFKISADVDCILKILNISETVRYVDDRVVHMEEFGISQSHYFRKLREHTLIKLRHASLSSAVIHIPKKLLIDYVVVPLWVKLKNLKKFKIRLDA